MLASSHSRQMVLATSGLLRKCWYDKHSSTLPPLCPALPSAYPHMHFVHVPALSHSAQLSASHTGGGDGDGGGEGDGGGGDGGNGGGGEGLGGGGEG